MNSQHFCINNGTTKIGLIFVFLVAFLSFNSAVHSQKKEFIVMLDAGHGGHDPGNIGIKKIREKDVALKIALEVGKLLASTPNIKVLYTRKKDVFVNLWERGNMANEAGADLFVSLHCNSWSNSQPHGIETYVLGLDGNKKNMAVAKAENKVILLEENYKEKYKGFDPNSPESFIGLELMQEEYLDQSIQLASLVQENLIHQIKGKDRGVKQQRFVVLYQTYMPSILVESGFLSSPLDYKYMSTNAGQAKISKAIFEGIKKYVYQLELNTVVNNESLVSNQTSTKVEKEIKKDVYENVDFKVQIASGSRKLETKSYNFKGLKNVERAKVGRSYKYYLGNTSNYNSIQGTLKIAKSKGFTSAFIVAFIDGQKVDVTKVLEKS